MSMKAVIEIGWTDDGNESTSDPLAFTCIGVFADCGDPLAGVCRPPGGHPPCNLCTDIDF